MTQAVHLRAGHTLHTVTADLVRPRDGDFALDQEFDDLIVVCVGSEHDGSDVRCELGKLGVHH